MFVNDRCDNIYANEWKTQKYTHFAEIERPIEK